MHLTRPELVLAALSPANGGPFTPVQVQKLFFLIDREIPQKTGGPHFRFVPYNYGPFDSAVYAELDSQSQHGLVSIGYNAQGLRSFALTASGQEAGKVAMAKLEPAVSSYIGSVVNFVRGVSFAQLVSEIYSRYPEMRANSVFQPR
jgi:uncharacterized protein